MSKRLIASLSVAAIALAAGSAYSQTQFGTAAEARAMEEKAVTELKNERSRGDREVQQRDRRLSPTTTSTCSATTSTTAARSPPTSTRR